MGLRAEGRPTDEDEVHAAAEEGADLVEDDAVADGRGAAALRPVVLVGVAVVEHLLEGRAALRHGVLDVLADPAWKRLSIRCRIASVV